MVVGLFATSVAFADAEIGNGPISLVIGFLQDFKYGDSYEKTGVAASEEVSAQVISDLESQMEDLTTRIDSIETPSKIHTTELSPITEIDCSNRNMVEAFLSGWCPHPTRNIYFIEDSRIL